MSISRSCFSVQECFNLFHQYTLQQLNRVWTFFCALTPKSLLRSRQWDRSPQLLSCSSVHLQTGLAFHSICLNFQLYAFSTESKMSKQLFNVVHDLNISKLLQDKPWYDRFNSSPMIASLSATDSITSVFWCLTKKLTALLGSSQAEISLGRSMICSNYECPYGK